MNTSTRPAEEIQVIIIAREIAPFDRWAEDIMHASRGKITMANLLHVSTILGLERLITDESIKIEKERELYLGFVNLKIVVISSLMFIPERYDLPHILEDFNELKHKPRLILIGRHRRWEFDPRYPHAILTIPPYLLGGEVAGLLEQKASVV